MHKIFSQLKGFLYSKFKGCGYVTNYNDVVSYGPRYIEDDGGGYGYGEGEIYGYGYGHIYNCSNGDGTINPENFEMNESDA